MGYRYAYDQTREGDGFYGGGLRKGGRVSRPQFVDELFELFERQAGWNVEARSAFESEEKKRRGRGVEGSQDDDGVRREADERRSPALEHPAHAFVLERVCDDGRDRRLPRGVHDL